MKYLLIILFFAVIISVNYSQNILTLEQCYQIAKEKYPAYYNTDLYSNISQLQLKNIKNSYLPKLNLNGQATYQSDVTKLDIPIDDYFTKVLSSLPNMPANIQTPEFIMPELKKDQYKIAFEVNQLIYDGGLTNSRKLIEQADLEVNLQQVKVELYQLKEKINSFYFAILLIQEKQKALNLMSNELKKRLQIMESGLKNGIIKHTDLDNLNAELIKLEQQLIELDLNKLSAIKSLGILLDQNFDESHELQLPTIDIFNEDNIRPEIKYFDLQSEKLEASKKILSRKNYPMLLGFGQFGYGRPGLNMLSDEFDTFYIVGAKFTWNLWDWKQTSREKQILTLHKQIIDSKKDVFLKNINIASNNEKVKIEKMAEIIEKDKQIILYRENISKSSASKLENGIINSNDYLTDLNAETQAKINMETHKIQLIQTKINYKTTLGQ